MWPFYTTLSEDGRLTESLRAEHVALTLYAVHQQSQPVPVHREGIGFGKAARTLRNSGLYSEEAVDRRFVAAATSGSLAELSVHLRGLVTQMRALRDSGFDYTRLFRDLRSWQRPERRAAVRRRWGAEYFAFAPDESRREEIEKAVAGPRSGHE
jgi:CRISPR system Cascade subunit CasB